MICLTNIRFLFAILSPMRKFICSENVVLLAVRTSTLYSVNKSLKLLLLFILTQFYLLKIFGTINLNIWHDIFLTLMPPVLKERHKMKEKITYDSPLDFPLELKFIPNFATVLSRTGTRTNLGVCFTLLGRYNRKSSVSNSYPEKTYYFSNYKKELFCSRLASLH
jgi:hypothetical protein